MAPFFVLKRKRLGFELNLLAIRKCVAPDLRAIQAFVVELTTAPQARNVEISLALKNCSDRAARSRLGRPIGDPIAIRP